MTAIIYQLIGFQLYESSKKKYSKQQIEEHKLKYTKHFFKYELLSEIFFA
jgi:hypothetical protein